LLVEDGLETTQSPTNHKSFDLSRLSSDVDVSRRSVTQHTDESEALERTAPTGLPGKLAEFLLVIAPAVFIGMFIALS
jgi:hypothetical protein